MFNNAHWVSNSQFDFAGTTPALRHWLLEQSRLLAAEQEKQQASQAATRKSLVGSGDRSERIRTYNYPQGRVTDHRINLTLYKLDEVMEGDLSPIIDPLVQEYQAEQMAVLSED